MIRNLAWIVAIIVMALLQTNWPDLLKLQNVVPDLMLALVVYLGLRETAERAMFTGVLGGIVLDVASNAVLGHHVLCLVIAGFAIAQLSRRIVSEHPAIKVALVLGASLANGLLYTIIQYIQNPNIPFTYMIISSVAPTAFYTALLTPLLFIVLAQGLHGRHLQQGGLV